MTYAEQIDGAGEALGQFLGFAQERRRRELREAVGKLSGRGRKILECLQKHGPQPTLNLGDVASEYGSGTRDTRSVLPDLQGMELLGLIVSKKVGNGKHWRVVAGLEK